MIIRPATESDVRQITEILVEDWKTAYKGIIDDSYLDSMTVENRYPIEAKRYQEYTVAVEGDEVLGYAWNKISDDEDADCEIIALYVRYSKRKCGIGRALMEDSMDTFRKAGRKSLIIWCLEANHESRRFYEKMGGKEYMTGTHRWGDRDYDLIAYLYPLEREIRLGDTVTVTVDRPLGSRHPEYPDMIYHVNYGYIKGVIAPDGEEQDAYILGVDEPVDEFTGEVIAVVRREDDVEKKLVVAPEGSQFTAEQVASRIRFAEKYYKSHVVMKLEGIGADAEDISDLGFEVRNDRSHYYLYMDVTPSKDQIMGLLSLLTENEELFFWNFYHRTVTDPGSYVSVYAVDGKYMIMEANHGWSGSYLLIEPDDLTELIIRNWDKDWDMAKDFVNAVRLSPNYDPDELFRRLEKPIGTFVPDYSVTAW